MNETTEIYNEHVDMKLIIRQRIFIVIISILVVISIINIVDGKIGIILSLSSFTLSLLVGLGLSRIFAIKWHPKKAKVVAQLDALGTTLLIIYMCIEIWRKWVFEHWLSGATLNAYGLIVLGGLLLGRFIGTSMKITDVLVENKKLEE